MMKGFSNEGVSLKVVLQFMECVIIISFMRLYICIENSVISYIKRDISATHDFLIVMAELRKNV